MKFNDVKGNFGKIEFHKPTQNMTGTGMQIKGLEDGKVQIQMAKQMTPHSRESQATYAWTVKDKNVLFNLSADELRKIIKLIRLALKGKANLFVQDKHNKNFQGRSEDQPFTNVKLYHNGGGGKTILLFVKEFRNELQLELDVFSKTCNIMFSFSKEEMEKLEMLFYFHQARELPVPEGIMSCVLDEDKEVLKMDFMPNLSVGDFITMTINGSKKCFKIKSKTFVTQKNMIVYAV